MRLSSDGLSFLELALDAIAGVTPSLIVFPLYMGFGCIDTVVSECLPTGEIRWSVHYVSPRVLCCLSESIQFYYGIECCQVSSRENTLIFSD